LAGKKQNQADTASTPIRAYWMERVDAGVKKLTDFHAEGDNVVSRYRLEKGQNKNYWRDKYNILYSSTETIKPSLYSSTPKVQATNRHKDRSNPSALMAVELIESCGQYAIEEVDFDSVINNCVEDFLLPGWGLAWVRYDPEFTTVGEGDDAYDDLTYEGLAVDYVYWKDFISDDTRTWEDKEWIARRVYFNKAKATKRFGKDKADKLSYTYRPADDGKETGRTIGLPGDQAIIWEIWDKNKREVVWFCPDYPGDVLDTKADPLKLQHFWPCPRPLRAVSTTSTFVPQSFYSQYKEQAEALDLITARIRSLTKALRVVGVYDSSQEALAKLLTGEDNRMVACDNWAAFAGQGGIQGSVVYLPITEIAQVLAELYKQREIAKNEIYEITGFSDIVRGISKASETLGAQEIKNNWATGRLSLTQKEVQRFCRDIVRIMSEIICEHFSDESLALYAGFEPPPITPEEQQAAAQHAHDAMSAMTLGRPAPPPPPPTAQQMAIQQFRGVVKLLKSEKQRCALIGIETDSTIQPDEAQERKDRLEFLGQIGAFLQQAGPMALQYPDMRGLLGAIMMFTIRTFRASRPLEKEFEDFQKALAQQPAMPPPGSKEGGQGGGDPHGAQAKVQSEQIKQESAQALQQQELQMEKYKIDKQEETKQQKQQQDHEYRMAQLDMEQRRLGLEQEKNILQAHTTGRQEARADVQQQHDQSMDHAGAVREDKALAQAAIPVDKPA
jgi:hypothetical protein